VARPKKLMQLVREESPHIQKSLEIIEAKGAARDRRVALAGSPDNWPDHASVVSEGPALDESIAAPAGSLEDERGYAMLHRKLDAGHSVTTALMDMEKDKSPFATRALYQRFITEFVAKNLIPPKAETAMIRAGRQKFMVEALHEGDLKKFTRVAALAIKDPALNLTQNTPSVVINVGDVKTVFEKDDSITIEFESEEGEEKEKIGG